MIHSLSTCNESSSVAPACGCGCAWWWCVAMMCFHSCCCQLLHHQLWGPCFSTGEIWCHSECATINHPWDAHCMLACVQRTCSCARSRVACFFLLLSAFTACRHSGEKQALFVKKSKGKPNSTTTSSLKKGCTFFLCSLVTAQNDIEFLQCTNNSPKSTKCSSKRKNCC